MEPGIDSAGQGPDNIQLLHRRLARSRWPSAPARAATSPPQRTQVRMTGTMLRSVNESVELTDPGVLEVRPETGHLGHATTS
jgi:hypothetical protein